MKYGSLLYKDPVLSLFCVLFVTLLSQIYSLRKSVCVHMTMVPIIIISFMINLIFGSEKGGSSR